jgi:hypothetical protein
MIVLQKEPSEWGSQKEQSIHVAKIVLQGSPHRREENSLSRKH